MFLCPVLWTACDLNVNVFMFRSHQWALPGWHAPFWRYSPLSLFLLYQMLSFPAHGSSAAGWAPPETSGPLQQPAAVRLNVRLYPNFSISCSSSVCLWLCFFRLLSNSWNQSQINISHNRIIFQLISPETCVAQQNSFQSLSRVCVCC